MSKIILRDYQQDIYEKIKIEFKKGHKGVCAVLPCRSREIIFVCKNS